MTCIITGCVLRNGGQNVGGDLHRIGDAYVFNAIVTENGATRWVDDDTYSHYQREVDASGSVQYFERRGVVVFSRAGAVLNEAAHNYLRGTPQ
jgi:hypothetical protein